MAAIAIQDLHTDRTLDDEERSSVNGGGGAPWVYGWISPYVDEAARFGGIVNFYQTNNFYIADQMNNQIEVIAIHNSAASANINVTANQTATNNIG